MTKTIQRDFDLNCLLYPAEAFRRPTDVLEDADLTLSEKRAILASWASDACAVEGTPELRRWAGAAPVSFDDVMDALKKPDGAEVEKPAYGKLMTRAQRLKADGRDHDSHHAARHAPEQQVRHHHLAERGGAV